MYVPRFAGRCLGLKGVVLYRSASATRKCCKRGRGRQVGGSPCTSEICSYDTRRGCQNSSARLADCVCILTTSCQSLRVLIVHTHNRYAEQVDKVNRLREETVRAIIKNSSEVVMFKEEVSKQLKQVHDFAEAN